MAKINYPTYDDIHKACLYLAHQIQMYELYPDVIVGVTRGGLMPAIILSQMLNIEMVPVAYSSKEGNGDDLNHKNELPQFHNCNILIVDDICDSGHTLKELFDHFTMGCNTSVTTACIYYKHHKEPIFVPNLKWITIPTNSNWIIFPWEKDILVSKELL